ncbi:MAG: FecR domain-containing protein, partial [Bacteroidota bacterium]|nr:FecR domain-containing protein [Bacteroidota bacterium]
GIATEQEKKEVFHSKESTEMLSKEWENYSEVKKSDFGLDKEEIYSEMKSKITETKKVKRISAFNQFIAKYAAFVLIPLVVGSLFYTLLVLRPDMINNLTMVTKENSRGQRSELVLPDGTKVWLNTQSKISYPEKFIGKYRTVQLEGEAFFDVVKNPRKPFLVKTDKLDIEVLGTSFNVMAYKSDKIIETTLVTGKVSVKRRNPKTKKVQKAILTPNHQAVFYKNQEKFILDQVDVDNYTSWKSGIITFDNESLDQVINVLERWYDIDFIVEEEIVTKNNYTLTITDESLEEVINLIEKTTPELEITASNNEVNIFPKNN